MCLYIYAANRDIILQPLFAKSYFIFVCLFCFTQNLLCAILFCLVWKSNLATGSCQIVYVFFVYRRIITETENKRFVPKPQSNMRGFVELETFFVWLFVPFQFFLVAYQDSFCALCLYLEQKHNFVVSNIVRNENSDLEFGAVRQKEKSVNH